MTDFDLNLSTRPFPAYRLANLALACALFVIAAISVWQVYGFFHYSSMTNEISDKQRNAQVDAESLRKSVAELDSKLDRPESAAKLKEIGFLNGLIARKELSWTRLFATLEQMVPDSVHLASLKPDVAPSGDFVILHIEVHGKTIGDVSQFVHALEQSATFEKVVVTIEDKNAEPEAGTDVTVTLTTNYYPQRENQ